MWVYGEQCRWWGPPLQLPESVGRGRRWEEVMPGITRAIAYVRDPMQAARDEIAQRQAAGTLTNLARNADFAQPVSKQDGGLPAEFGVWQDEKDSSGTFAWDGNVGAGAARATGVKRGCFIQAHPVKPGEAYALQADGLPRGASHPTLTVRWQTAEGQWTREAEDRTFAFAPKTGDWQTVWGVVTVPPDTGKLVVLLNVTGQAAEDACWFDNLRVYRFR